MRTAKQKKNTSKFREPKQTAGVKKKKKAGKKAAPVSKPMTPKRAAAKVLKRTLMVAPDVDQDTMEAIVGPDWKITPKRREKIRDAIDTINKAFLTRLNRIIGD